MNPGFKFQFGFLLYKKLGRLRKDLNLKTPVQALEKSFELKPQIFKQNPSEFKNKIICLNHCNDPRYYKQPRETRQQKKYKENKINQLKKKIALLEATRKRNYIIVPKYWAIQPLKELLEKMKLKNRGALNLNYNEYSI